MAAPRIDPTSITRAKWEQNQCAGSTTVRILEEQITIGTRDRAPRECSGAANSGFFSRCVGRTGPEDHRRKRYVCPRQKDSGKTKNSDLSTTMLNVRAPEECDA